MYRASDTEVIPEWELEDAMRTMPDSQYQQEYECSFNAAVQGSYYGALMEKAEGDKKADGDKKAESDKKPEGGKKPEKK